MAREKKITFEQLRKICIHKMAFREYRTKTRHPTKQSCAFYGFDKTSKHSYCRSSECPMWKEMEDVTNQGG